MTVIVVSEQKHASYYSGNIILKIVRGFIRDYWHQHGRSGDVPRISIRGWTHAEDAETGFLYTIYFTGSLDGSIHLVYQPHDCDGASALELPVHGPVMFLDGRSVQADAIWTDLLGSLASVLRRELRL